MARSQIIKELINDDKSISVSLHNLLVIAYELENNELNKWVKNELNGYGNNEEIPEYRKNLPNTIFYSGINGDYKVTNQPLPIQVFGDYIDQIRSLSIVKNSVLELENSKEGRMQIDLTMFAGIVQKNAGIMCFNIVLEFGRNISDQILSNVKTKTLESLLLLEKEFGLLDELLIEDSKLNEEKIEEVNHNINSIIFSDGARY